MLTCPHSVDPHRTKSLVATVVSFEMMKFDVTVIRMTVTWNHAAPVAMHAAHLSNTRDEVIFNESRCVKKHTRPVGSSEQRVEQQLRALTVGAVGGA